jgi:hypothetical protein
MSAIGVARETIKAWLEPVMRFERHIAAASMVFGFGFDNYAFGRIDRPGANIVFGGYLLLAAATIVVGHRLQSRADSDARLLVAKLREEKAKLPAEDAEAVADIPPVSDEAPAEGGLSPATATIESKLSLSARWRRWLPVATQFAFGSLWSGFLVFYSRSASLAVSWLFLVTLLGFLIGNEVFKKYHARLVFSTLLFFFALYSYAIFIVPVVTGTIGRVTFLASGALAIFLFLLFLRLLVAVGRQRFAQSRWRILGGAIAIAAAMNAFYFTSILPPLPLALSNVGIFHSVKRTGAVYSAVAEKEPLYTAYGIGKPVIHLMPGQPMSLYSAVFAPIKLSTRITHLWQWYDPNRRHWISQSRVSFAINGGRDGGYRAYTIKTKPKPGDWRVDIETIDGRLIGRIKFVVAIADTPVATYPVTVN